MEQAVRVVAAVRVILRVLVEAVEVLAEASKVNVDAVRVIVES
jgi:hypothetical protein